MTRRSLRRQPPGPADCTCRLGALRRVLALGFALPAVLAVAGCTGPDAGEPAAEHPPASGAPAPAVRGTDLSGREVRPSGPVLLALLRPTAGAGSAELADSRTAAVVTASMAEQYRSLGLTVVIADVAPDQAPERGALVNLSYDWHLGGVTLLDPASGRRLAASYGATRTPDTYLVAQDGTVAGHWPGALSAVQVAPAVQHALGAAPGAVPSATVSP
ncbi:peroxiredoxin family protein [Streptomyces sp. NPDC050256]|uniref:peroxiredoxin family protein n=1 Tax=Streptomyces sp. NPDC050256 TaxID=3365607 RepID=UPI00378742BE